MSLGMLPRYSIVIINAIEQVARSGIKDTNIIFRGNPSCVTIEDKTGTRSDFSKNHTGSSSCIFALTGF
jgi:hypothetical protein